MQLSFSGIDLARQSTLVVTLYEDRIFSPSAEMIDQQTGGALTRALAGSRMTGKPGEMLDLLVPSGVAAPRVLLVGIGAPGALDAAKAETLGGGIAGVLLGQPATQAAIAFDVPPGCPVAIEILAAHLAAGARLRGYRFDTYRTRLKPEDKPVLADLTVMSAEPAKAEAAYADLARLGDAVLYARDLVSEPANILHPESYADRLRDLTRLGLEVEVLGEAEMTALGMGALLGVGQGSVRESKLVVLRWTGGAPDTAPLALCGKGVCFDTGGISLKPSKGMEEMKWDMAGSAAVVGAMMAVAGRKAKANVVGVVGLVENMPDGKAQRPGDIVTSMSGQTIEVQNTDAEGRLVLADVLWYTQDRFKPVAMIDLATLTGAIITALGAEYAGLFASDDPLADGILAAGKAVGEPLWRLPVGDAYDKMINCDCADMKNIADGTAGSIIGAVFLQRFTNGVPWAHLDIAGVAWGKKDQPITPKGATGWGVRLLDRLVRDKYEG